MIVFTKDISQADLLLAYVNNIVRFKSNYTASPILKCELTIGTIVKTLFPDPTGYFYYNFQELMKAVINNDNFKDDLDLDIANNYLYDWTSRIYYQNDFIFKIFFADSTDETLSKNLKWLSGYIQIEDYKRRYPIQFNADKVFILSSFSEANNRKTFLKYWEGYPFDISIYVPGTKIMQVTNQTNLLDYTFTECSTITRFAFCDGRLSTTIDDVLPLRTGFNELLFKIGADNGYYATVEKLEYDCGTYIKWINEYGGWSYWLFGKAARSRATKDLGVLENDFENIPDTISPTLQIGQTSQDTISVITDTINEAEMQLLSSLFDSPKIYLFTGEPFAKNSFNDWLEITLKSSTFKIADYKRNMFNLPLQFDLPARNTRTL